MFKKICAAMMSAVLLAGQAAPMCVGAAAETEIGIAESGADVIKNVTATFDGKEYTFDIMHINEYPAMALKDIAKLIGASLNGTTLTKEGISLTFSEGSRLAADSYGHIMLECTPKMYNGSLYVPISFIVPVLNYNMHYNRFAKELTVTSGNNYPQTAESVFYVSDFGAVGDGVTDDREAVEHAVNAALECGKAASVEFEAGKTYLLGERMDRWAMIYLEDAENITINGNGCEILLKTPTNTFIEMQYCRNIKVNNIDVDYAELPFTQGRIISTDTDNGKFVLKIDDGYPMPADDDWVKNYSTDERSGGWWFGQIMDSTEDRMKYTNTDNLFIESVKCVGDGEYEITARESAAQYVKYAETGDRFVINTRYGAYSIADSGNETKQGSTSEIYLNGCSDIEFNGFYMYSTIWMFCGIGFSEGKTTFKDSGFKTKPGRLLCANSDGIHTWLNRGALVLDNCTFMNNLDDHNNTYTQGGFVRAVTGTAQYKLENDINAREGDEVQVYNPTDKQLLGRAFIKGISTADGGKYIVTLDRSFDNIATLDDGSQTPTLIYNVDSGSRGNSIRNCKFMYSRRYAVLERSVNSIIENNKVIGCGSGIAAMNELTTATKSEGGFPSSLTVRGNEITGDGNTYGYIPIEVKHWKALPGSSRAIDGALIENNSINVPNALGSMELECISDLYLLNNDITNSASVKSGFCAVNINNCDIKEIDTMTFNCAEGAESMINIIGSDVSEEDIKNITVQAPASAKPYVISESGQVAELFESGLDEDIAENIFPNDFMSVPTGYKADMTLSYAADKNGGKALRITRQSGGNTYADIGFIANLNDNAYMAQKDGTLTIEFDCKSPRLRLQALSTDKVIEMLRYDSTGDFCYGSKQTSNYDVSEWHTIKAEIDYHSQTVQYYIDGAALDKLSFSDFGAVTAENDIFTCLRFTYYASAGMEMLIDNFKMFYRGVPRASASEYVDGSGNLVSGSAYVSGLEEIRIRFNSGMNKDTLKSAIVLYKNGEAIDYTGEYDDRSRAYVLKPVSGEYFESPADYTITVSQNAVTADGRSLYEETEFTVKAIDSSLEVIDFDISCKGKDLYEVSATVINGDSACGNVCPVMAAYKEGRLVLVKTESVPMILGMNEFTAELNAEGKEYDTVKAFVWSSLSEAVPYAEAVHICGIYAEDFSSEKISAPLKNISDANYVGEAFPETSAGDYALNLFRINNTGIDYDGILMHNLSLELDFSDEDIYPAYAKAEGKTVIAFDYISNNVNNATLMYWNGAREKYENILIFYPTSAYGANNSYICDFSADTEHHVEMVIDYDAAEYSVTIDSNEVKTIGFSDALYAPEEAGTMRLFRIHSWAADTMYYQIDNLIVYHK